VTDSVIDPLFLSFQEAIAGRYSLERELGRGGMGVVYLAREVRLDRRVAIKLLPPELAAQSSLRDRFMREARTAARLSHPYIVPLHAVDESDDFVYYSMAYVDGETLAQCVGPRGPLSPRDATRILREVAWALAYAHAQGIVHRDIKPANILLERGTDRAMVTDFGIARTVHSAGETVVGELLGTPEYMSPEQAGGEQVDGRSDLYSLGVVAFFALTGQLPFNAPTAQALLAQHLTKPAPSLGSAARGVPRALSQAVDRCLQKDPAQRFESGEALADALAPSLERHTEVPIPVRVFLDRRRVAQLIAPVAIAISPAGAFIGSIAAHGPTFLNVGGLTLLAVGAIGLPLWMLARRLRALARLGYGPADLAAGARIGFARKREEFNFEFGPEPKFRERIFRVAGFIGYGIAAAAAIGMLTGGPPPLLIPVATIAAYLATVATIISKRWRRLRHNTGPLWASFWEGRVGRALGRVTGARVDTQVVAAERPTELAIAMSAGALYESLSKELRESLGDVPETLKGLESVARAVRGRIEQLESAIAEAQRSRAAAAAGEHQDALLTDLRAARAAAETRLADVVTALETLRLDLLRLSAGTGSAEGITRALEAARTFSDDADRMIAARREVEESLARP
jgi:eukaryotic-like serine/threonine-protein kinase